MNDRDRRVDRFEANRPHLRGVASRMLGATSLDESGPTHAEGATE
jgi:hypothetical protein